MTRSTLSGLEAAQVDLSCSSFSPAAGSLGETAAASRCSATGRSATGRSATGRFATGRSAAEIEQIPVARQAPTDQCSDQCSEQCSEQAERAIAAERRRIATALHDVTIRQLFDVGLAVQGTMAITGDPRIAHRLEEIVDELDATISAIRSTVFAFEVRPAGTSTGLRRRVVDAAIEAAELLGHDPAVSFSGPVDTAVPEAQGDRLLAVLQGALSDVARHAHASATTIELSVTTDIVLQVTDDGAGTTGAPRASGSRDWRRWAEALGGGLEVTDRSAGGTCLRWWVPAAALQPSGPGPSEPSRPGPSEPSRYDQRAVRAAAPTAPPVAAHVAAQR